MEERPPKIPMIRSHKPKKIKVPDIDARIEEFIKAINRLELNRCENKK